MLPEPKQDPAPRPRRAAGRHAPTRAGIVRWHTAAFMAALCTGCGVYVEDRTSPLLARNAASFYELTARIERGVPGVSIGSVTAVTQYGSFAMAPGGGADEWTMSLPLNPCVNGFHVQFEADWSFLLAANTEREPALGVHQKWLDGQPPAECSNLLGRLFVVDSTADLPDDAPGDGTCRAVGGSACTLRAAVMEANANPGQDRIELGSATYILTREGSDDNALAGDLDITEVVAITGNGAVIDAGSTADRIFDVRRGVDFELRGVTVQGGRASQGAGIRNQGRLHAFSTRIRDNQAEGAGGGIQNDGGFVELTEVHVGGNRVNGAPAAQGGGLQSIGESSLVVIRASSFADNESAQHGGGLLVFSGAIEARDTTFSGNRAGVHGGGLFVNPAARARLRNVTITLNRADADGSGGGDGGGIKHGFGADLVIANSIVAGNGRGASSGMPDDCNGTLASVGFNLIGAGDGCVGLGGDDQVGTAASPIDARLGPLTLSGNGTHRHTPLPTSPALDAANPEPPNDARTSRCTHVDQRGVERPQGAVVDGRKRCDIGAVERE
jgi:CSLREA domain-containing protein